MPIPTNIGKEFLDLFYHEIKDQDLSNSNKLNLFSLRVTNNSFAYNELVELLGNKLYHFALSRTEVKKLVDAGNLRTLVDRSKERLRNHLETLNGESDKEGGELGEILLYCFLEAYLNAPKILTKLELKTSSQLYVNGADGVHLLKLNEEDYQLIFGESKLHADLSQAIRKAFESIEKLLKKDKKKLNFEINLINSQLVKEAYDEKMYNALKQIIIPRASEDKINMDHSFGILLGYDINLTDEERKQKNSDFRINIRKRIKSEVESCIDLINNQIQKNHFTGYSFHIYVIPFSDLANKRKEIIEGLLK